MYLQALMTSRKQKVTSCSQISFRGLTQLAGSNELLAILFEENKEVKQALEEFEVVVSKAMKLDGHFEESEFKQKTVREDLYPTFHTWSLHIQKVLQTHIAS